MDCSSPGSSVRGILQAWILEWVAISSKGSSHQGLNPGLLCLLHCRQILYLLSHQGSPMQLSAPAAAAAKSLQSCPTLCNPIDGSPPGSPVPGILQARTLEWVAISFSNAWKWKVKVKSLSHVRLERPHGLQPTRLLRPRDFLGKSTGAGCHCLLRCNSLNSIKFQFSIWCSVSTLNVCLLNT